MAARQDEVDVTLPGPSPIVYTPVNTVFINGARAAVKGSVSKDKSVIIQGSGDVLIEGMQAARLRDKTNIGGMVATTSPNVLVNGR
jgi:uncharacterized Zn-binding protein involved in type VI secretion